MRLKEVYTPEVVCCGGQTSAGEAARLMRHKHVGDLVVVDDPEDARTPLGVVTDRDLAIEVLANGLDPAVVTVLELMRTPVVIADENEDTSQVAERMREHGVRRIPVVNARGSAVGIVTLDDLLAATISDASRLLEVMDKGRDRERRARR